MAANYTNVLSKTDKALNDFTSVARAEEIRLLDQAIAMIKELETDAKGNIKPSIANMRKIVVIKARIEKACDGKEYLAGIKDMLKSFDGIYQDQREYFSKEFTHKAIEGRVADKAIVLKKLAADNTIDGLTRAGLSANVTNKLNDMITRAVTTGAHFPDLVKEMQAYLSPDGAEGALSKYANTYATTAMSQYVGQNNKLMTEGIETDWFMYVGSNIETTREFCQHLSKKKWVHLSELPEIIKGHIDGHECALNKKTGLPNGMIEGTTIENFQVNVGGWNCGHAFVPVHRLAVPADVRAKFEKGEGLVSDWERWKADNARILDIYTNEIRMEYNGISVLDRSMESLSYEQIQEEWNDSIIKTLRRCRNTFDSWIDQICEARDSAVRENNKDAVAEAERLISKYKRTTFTSDQYDNAMNGGFKDDIERLLNMIHKETDWEKWWRNESCKWAYEKYITGYEKKYDLSRFKKILLDKSSKYDELDKALLDAIDFITSEEKRERIEEDRKRREEEKRKNEERNKNGVLLSEVVSKLEKMVSERREVIRLPEDTTEDQIINRLCVGDMTGGSCSSLAFAYMGNRCGYDVLDFRGGSSMDYFSRRANIYEIVDKIGGKRATRRSDFASAHDLFKTMEEGHEYYFACAKHAAVIKKIGKELFFLELQSSSINGWKPLNDYVLANRFGAQNSHKYFNLESAIVDLDDFKKCADFSDMLEYINTDPAKQKKGSAGHER